MGQFAQGALIMLSSFAASSFIFWLRWRARVLAVDLNRVEEEARVGEQRLSKLKKHKQSILNKIEGRGKRRLERDEALAKDLDDLDEQNCKHEVRLDNRNAHQEERNAEIEERRKEANALKGQVVSQKRQLKKVKRRIKETLEQRADYTSREAIDSQIASLCSQVEVEVQQSTQRSLIEAEAYRDSRAQELMSLGRQRYFDPSPAEKLLTFVELPRSKKQRELFQAEGSEQIEMLSAVTGVNFNLDPATSRLLLRNSPETYTREVARLTYKRWINGGALDEMSLKAHHENSLKALEKESRQAGKAAADRLGLKGIHPEILHLVGKLLFRTSYTQNQWQHAIESAELCGMMAEELGLNVELARRATLLHDIGKVLWEETEAVGSHAVSGAAFAREFGEIPEIIHPIGAHHNDEAPSSALAYLVIAADTLSGARPGARRESSEAFSQHIEQLDELCTSVDGLRQHMIIQGGREVRLQVYPQKYTDLELTELTAEMAEEIEAQCVFPGQIKVTALREVITSAVAYARNRDRREGDQRYAGSRSMSSSRTPLSWGGERGSHHPSHAIIGAHR